MMMNSSSPNILLIIADQLTASALPVYGNPVCQTPHLSRLASSGTVFENAYCNFPLCAPARYALLTGQLASRVNGYDNASELAAATPTLPYYLSALGYQTSLIGKMHFVGPDQMHGFHERLTTDIYPSDFGWTPNWLTIPPHGPAGMSMRSVVEAGVCIRSLQFDFDDDVAHKTIQKIHDLARRQDKQPFFLTASFTHPHNPYVTTRQWWDRYQDGDIDAPKVAAIPYGERDPHSQRLYWLFRQDEHLVTDENIRTARHAYYANISYVDDQIGRILGTLQDTELDKDTIVIFTSDHGEMLGERGLWYKYTLLEPALKVPLIFHVPGLAPGRVSELVSHVDLLPTLHELASGTTPFQAVDALDGSSFASLLQGRSRLEKMNTFAAEFTAEGAVAPMVAVRKGEHKLIVSLVDPPQLFDLASDPLELHNLAGREETKQIEAELHDEVSKRWKLDELNSNVLSSQKRRRWIQPLLSSVERNTWDFQPFTDASKQYVRSGKQSSPTQVKGRARYPYVSPKLPDTPRDPT
jgi:choline-sulfatase